MNEVDFVTESAAYEVKYKEKLKSEDFKGLEAFGREYTKECFLINLGEQTVSEKNSTIFPYTVFPPYSE